MPVRIPLYYGPAAVVSPGISVALAILLLNYDNTFKGYFEISNRKPPRRGQPLYKGQLARPQSVLCLEVFTVVSPLSLFQIVSLALF